MNEDSIAGIVVGVYIYLLFVLPLMHYLNIV